MSESVRKNGCSPNRDEFLLMAHTSQSVSPTSSKPSLPCGRRRIIFPAPLTFAAARPNIQPKPRPRGCSKTLRADNDAYRHLLSALASNQLLAGGVGTLAFGSVIYVLRAVPQKMLEFLEKMSWSKVSVKSFSNDFSDVDAFIEGKRLNFFSRSWK